MRTTDLPQPAGLARRKTDEEVRSYRFLTYVLGGGVRFRAHKKLRDEVTPIRGAAIRGHLRFWWRACNPGGCSTLEDLHRLEGEVWGTTDHASPVVVQVVKQPSAPVEKPVFSNEQGRFGPSADMREIAYGAFPLQPKRELQKQGEQAGGVFDYGSSEFRVRLLFPDSRRGDVEAALWAWETFGGLGSRTRRGFGAIARVGPDSAPLSAVETALARLAQRPRIPGVPSLSGARWAVARDANSSALPAWKWALGKLQKLRQGVGVGRNSSTRYTNRPGRSRWPEADEIRRLTGQSAPMHSLPTVSVDRFPRAVFGMPIVFHFQNDPNDPRAQGDPSLEPLELRPTRFERFASPLILRPVPEARGFRAAALALFSPPPQAVLLAGPNRFPAEHRLTPAEAAAIPALGSHGKVFTDPLQRFLEEFAR
jgi:CRISPR-associated protein Cmr1